MASRYITNTGSDWPNDPGRHACPGNNCDYLEEALAHIVLETPPRNDKYSKTELHGLSAGPTGLAYLFHHVSARRPELLIAGKSASHWSRQYIDAPRVATLLDTCGLASERLAFSAVMAVITRDMAFVDSFVADAEQVIGGEFYDELMYGRAGALYMMRMIRHWVPEATARLGTPIREVTEVMRAKPCWSWHGKRYLGAVHGDIGILTQIILTTPRLATELIPTLDCLLSAQLPSGNWPSSEGSNADKLIQFCHGAPGFLFALNSLLGYFPQRREQIERAINRGSDCVWERGLLRKEPSLCHGALGNAL